MEDSNKGQRRKKFSWICKFLLTLYPELQLYSKTVKWTEGQERVEIGWRTLTSIWRTQRQDNKLTSSLPAKEGRKIQSRNRHFRTCNRRSNIPRTRWEMETNSISIKDNATNGKELWNIQQGTTSNSRSFDKVETISVGHYGTLWSLDGPWKLKVFPRASQTKQMTSSVVLEVIRLQFHSATYPRQDKYKGRYSFKKKSDQHERRQQRYPDA